ncbi:ABC transporter ATP-binding protein [Actinopolymorpha alba]|uniref:ABC transporter ATP-binding protein n=1 Tax=Actinopolymorpha alba TaxID=533267 RepID=UPI000361471A|nr:ABC transporter ATP-binding protein [Actinopolymorpha alba]
MPVISVENLRKRYGEHVAVDGVSFAVEKGEILGILGRNGAGKTTTVECLAGLRRPDSGQVRVMGLDPWRDRVKVRQVLGSQLQEGALPGKVRVGEAVKLYRSFYRTGADPDRLLADLGLHDKRRAFYDDLSGGQQQRLSIALALVGRPRIAILDELTTGLDPAARRETWQLIDRIRRGGVTIVLVTHVMEEAERLCDRIAVLDRGQIVALDTPEGLIARAQGEQEVRVRTQGAVDQAALNGLPEVTGLRIDGEHVVIRGRGNLLHTVTRALLSQDVVVTDARVRQVTLDDAFLTLTGRSLDEAPGGHFPGDPYEDSRTDLEASR